MDGSYPIAPPGAPPQQDPSTTIDAYLRMWSEASDEYSDARRESLLDEDYYNGKQWTDDELSKLKERKQPPSVLNVIKRKINGVAGVEIRGSSEPRAYPRQPQDQRAAEVATDALRYIKEKEDLTSAKTNVFIAALKTGVGAIEIGGEKNTVPITVIDGDEFFWDPRSRAADFGDARYMGQAKWMDADVAKATYAAAPEPPPLTGNSFNDQLAQQQHDTASDETDRIAGIIDATVSSSTTSQDDTFRDRPTVNFGDSKRRRVFIVDMAHRDPVAGWTRCIFTGAGILFQAPYEYRGEDGKLTHPYLPLSMYVDRRNWRYGMARDLRPIQDEINKRYSKALHLLTVNQVVMSKGAVASKAEARMEAARPDGVMEIQNPTARFEIRNNAELTSGQKSMLDSVMAFAERFGPNPQLLGEQGSAGSGRAILALQQAGLGELGVEFDRLRQWERRLYRTLFCRMKQYWTAPMYVRTTDDADAARFTALNGAPELDAQGQPQPAPTQPHPVTGEPVPSGPAPSGPMLTELDMDIIIDSAPEAATLQAEQFDTLTKLAQGGVPIPPEVILMASALPNKSQLLDKLQASQSQPNPMAQVAARKAAGEIEQLKAEIEKVRAQAELYQAQAAFQLAQAENLRASAALASAGTPVAQAAPGAPPAAESPADAAWRTISALEGAVDAQVLSADAAASTLPQQAPPPNGVPPIGPSAHGGPPAPQPPPPASGTTVAPAAGDPGAIVPPTLRAMNGSPPG